MITLYGIKNCDTVRRARRWLESQGHTVKVHDFRSDGLDRALVEHWLHATSAKSLVNKRSSSWKALDLDARQAIQAALDTDAAAANPCVVEALLEHPTLIKRPVVELSGQTVVGFCERSYAGLLAKQAG
ncbi:MAG: arsenate reductase [Gammaproteobacteria bacterium]|nr:arsenate reductase [Gammaproteobacteria bacterium]NND38906.1 arsenate reductase [Pseudomonadales bacterium]MBT8151984.1 arsenate reductase [Gammaproteobacteria bacterium]NNL10852.1 arsenate reductase [Pseudomonadales bacterium]NNM12389.1 arsenate reductase [Pseudomonadales bacterium]